MCRCLASVQSENLFHHFLSSIAMCVSTEDTITQIDDCLL